ncbi:hypothetical protein [Polaromonas sp. YR568]|uniref:hypothetical protein n=1 Tax=Polaromonas sp. YR568 TaxID=1855301 RepID=UPI00398BF3D9
MAELKVYSNGQEVAGGKPGVVGADWVLNGAWSPINTEENSSVALTDGRVGQGVPLASAKADVTSFGYRQEAVDLHARAQLQRHGQPQL